MTIIELREVCQLTGYSERSIQYAYKGDFKKKPTLPSYKVIGCKIFHEGQWKEIPQEFRKNRLVFVKDEVLDWVHSLI